MVAPLSNNMGKYSSWIRIWLSCIEFTTEAMISPSDAERDHAQTQNRNSDSQRCGNGIPYRKWREQHHQQRAGQKVDQARHQRGDQDGRGRNRRHLEAPQDVRFALLHRADARAEKAGAQDADREHHGQHLNDGPAPLGLETVPRR